MEPKTAANCRHFLRIGARQFGRLYAGVIRWFAADSLASRAFMMIAFGVPAGTALWTLAASSILNKTQR
jgi:hypothetical protein